MKIDYQRRIFGLDLMRACAIIFVVLAHLGYLVSFTEHPLAIYLLSQMGFLGVELFFVLSGFLIGRIVYRGLVKEEASISDLGYFWVRRWLRTLPNYYLMLLVNILIGLSVGYQLTQFDWQRDLWKYFFFLQNFHDFHLPFFPESWSLSIEEFAYLLGPALLFAMLPLFKNKNKAFLTMVLGILVLFLATKIIFHLTHDLSTLTQWNDQLKAIVIYRIDAIYYGMLAAWLSLNYPTLWKRNAAFSAILVSLLFVALQLIMGQGDFSVSAKPVFWNVLYLPLISILIAGHLPWLSGWKRESGLWTLLITRLSLWSYSMYLLHHTFLLYLFELWWPWQMESAFAKAILAFVYLASLLLLAAGLYRFYELPMMKLRDHPRVRRFFKK
ncbi:acyltransferase family protein [Croceiramulus getboli]|nr:acyltransferase [Flavobacteriaceae bacterium YJPT1-3]